MTIAELIQNRLDETGRSKTAAAAELGTTRPTLDAWLHGVYTPEPDHDRVKAIAAWTGESEARVLGMILTERGIDPDVLEELALVDFAKNRLNAEGKVNQPTIVGRAAHSHLQRAA